MTDLYGDRQHDDSKSRKTEQELINDYNHFKKMILQLLNNGYQITLDGIDKIISSGRTINRTELEKDLATDVDFGTATLSTDGHYFLTPYLS